MSLKEFVKIAFNSLLANKMRTFLSVLGIVIGVASVIVMVAIGTGAQNQIAGQIGALGSNLVTVMPGRVVGRAGQMSRDVTDVFTMDMADQIRTSLSGAKNVVPTVETSALAVYQNNNARVPVIGVTPEYEEVVDHHPIVGRYIKSVDIDDSAKVAVLGAETASELFGNENPVGQEVRLTINGQRFVFLVVGVMESKGQVMFSNFDSRIYVPTTTLLNRAMANKYVSGFSIQARSQEHAKPLVKELEFFLVRRLGNTDKFRVMSQDTILEAVSNATGTMTLLLGAVAGIALLVGGIGIMNIMLVTVSERTREIGTRKAIGAKRKQILLQFLMESITLSAAGGLLGLIVGWGGGYLVSRIISWPFSVSLPAAGIAIGFSTMVGLFFGIYPAQKAAKLDPVVALRHE